MANFEILTDALPFTLTRCESLSLTGLIRCAANPYRHVGLNASHSVHWPSAGLLYAGRQ